MFLFRSKIHLLFITETVDLHSDPARVARHVLGLDIGLVLGGGGARGMLCLFVFFHKIRGQESGSPDPETILFFNHSHHPQQIFPPKIGVVSYFYAFLESL